MTTIERKLTTAIALASQNVLFSGLELERTIRDVLESLPAINGPVVRYRKLVTDVRGTLHFNCTKPTADRLDAVGELENFRTAFKRGDTQVSYELYLGIDRDHPALASPDEPINETELVGKTKYIVEALRGAGISIGWQPRLNRGKAELIIKAD